MTLFVILLGRSTLPSLSQLISDAAAYSFPSSQLRHSPGRWGAGSGQQTLGAAAGLLDRPLVKGIEQPYLRL